MLYTLWRVVMQEPLHIPASYMYNLSTRSMVQLSTRLGTFWHLLAGLVGKLLHMTKPLPHCAGFRGIACSAYSQ